MAENKYSGYNQQFNEAVCIDTNKIYDSCADKDCISDIRVCFTDLAQEVLNSACSIKCKSSEVINCFIEVEEVPFNKGFYSLDITFFFKVYFDTYTCAMTPPVPIEGLVIFCKKCILYGGDSKAKTFSSVLTIEECNDCILLPNLMFPRAKVQCMDPICLDAKLCRPCDCCCSHHICNIPCCVSRQFAGNFTQAKCEKAVKVTLGLFSILLLEREVQLMIPSYDFCVPTKECNCDKDDPCESFKKIKFPLDEFFPVDDNDLDDDGHDYIGCCGCG